MPIADLLTNPVHETVVRHVVQLARDLGLNTVAEGVESYEIWARLNELRCDTRPRPHVIPPVNRLA
jgi:EAL domain-containing protein (putative c-di-GMP-specific phosphodiesterase class I)